VPQHEEALMTIAQQLEQKGIEIGLQVGLQLGEMKGREEGKCEERLEIAVKMLKSGYPFQAVKELTGLSDEILAGILPR
jgi:predicted transposase/invertase (TIGR01784 family)